ncbi:iron complex outermembrane receptor protein [Winogradskyella wandonensis]|uniref:Iron complex outermembrane receptor protein n=1 Tax=Winogradskyella wandonensis TaxID=1442586 RepID=A0A4R1KYF2_9FLAO|nr:TonB-dependent receptor [Winogradskyella wandonensis]TCK69199.1 iron complex outermembrane receptor protein [Winogradskyella wandonensis]
MKYLSLLLAVVSFYNSFSQNCNSVFLGELTDYHDKTPIVGATVYIKTLDKYTTSDLDGKFKIENLCNGPLTLVITHVACETKTLNYNVTGDLFREIALEHHIEELNEVSVKTSATKKATVTAQETLIKSDALKKYSSLSLGDALKEVPGISSINTGNTIVKPMVNGMHSSRLLIINNNVRLQDQEWGIEHAPNIDINSAKQISVIKGSGALRYGGDAIGGVVVLNPARVILRDTLYGSTTINGQTNGRGYNITSSLNKTFKSGWFANIQGTAKQNGDFEAPDYTLTNTGLKSQGFSVNGGKKKFESGFEVFYSFLNNEIGILRSSHIGNVEDLVDAINSQQPFIVEDFSYDINSPKQEVTHHLLKGLYYRRFKNFGKVSLQYDYQNNQRFEFDVRVGDDRNKPALDLNLQTHSVLADVVLDNNLRRKISFGVLGRYQNNFANPDTGVRRLIPDYDKYDFGTYVTTEWVLNDVLTLDAGLRYDFNRIDAKKFYRTSRWNERGYDSDFSDIVIEDFGTQLLTNPVFNYHNISASTGVRYNLNDVSYLLGNYGLSSRPPNPSELFSDGLHHSAARIELGDLRLNKEISNRVSVSYNLQKSKYSLNVDAFLNRINDFMYLRPDSVEQTIRGAFPVWEFTQTNASFFGIDLASTYNFSENWTWSNISAYVKADDLSQDRPLIDIPAFNTRNAIIFNKPEWKNFTASLTSEWVFEQQEFPDFNFETLIASTNETVLVDISTPPPGYHLLHLYSEATFNISDKTKLNVALSVNNLLDTNYRAYLNRLRYFADDLGRNIMLQLQLTY